MAFLQGKARQRGLDPGDQRDLGAARCLGKFRPSAVAKALGIGGFSASDRIGGDSPGHQPPWYSRHDRSRQGVMGGLTPPILTAIHPKRAETRTGPAKNHRNRELGR